MLVSPTSTEPSSYTREPLAVSPRKRPALRPVRTRASPGAPSSRTSSRPPWKSSGAVRVVRVGRSPGRGRNCVTRRRKPLPLPRCRSARSIVRAWVAPSSARALSPLPRRRWPVCWWPSRVRRVRPVRPDLDPDSASGSPGVSPSLGAASVRTGRSAVAEHASHAARLPRVRTASRRRHERHVRRRAMVFTTTRVRVRVRGRRGAACCAPTRTPTPPRTSSTMSSTTATSAAARWSSRPPVFVFVFVFAFVFVFVFAFVFVFVFVAVGAQHAAPLHIRRRRRERRLPCRQ